MVKFLHMTLIAAILVLTLQKGNLSAQNSMQKMIESDACSLLTPGLINAMTGVKMADLKKVNSFANYSNCNYEWERPDKDKIEKENTEILKKSIGTGKIPRLKPTRCKVSLIVEPKYSKKDAAQKSFNTAIKSKSRYDQKVKGIGDNAVWSNDNNKLTVIDGNYVFHIIADVYDGDNKNFELAKKIAAELAKKI